MRLKIIMQKYFTFQPFITTERDENISLGIELVKNFLKKTFKTRENLCLIMLKRFYTGKTKTKENYVSSRREAHSN